MNDQEVAQFEHVTVGWSPAVESRIRTMEKQVDDLRGDFAHLADAMSAIEDLLKLQGANLHDLIHSKLTQ